MLLNGIYHMRRVPREKDGRSEEQKEDPRYREHRSLWFDIDEDKMYSEARGLRETGFDPGWATMQILLRGMENSDPSHHSTRHVLNLVARTFDRFEMVHPRLC